MKTTIISKNIRFLRRNKKWSQSFLGNKLDRSESTVQMWETDLRSPTMAMVGKLAEIFSIDINTLVYADLETGEFNKTGFVSELYGKIDINDVALEFVKNPLVSSFGDYNLDQMTELEKNEFIEHILDSVKFFATKYKKKH